MRIAIVSDIHGNLLALEAVITDIKQHKPDLIVNLGDCVSGPLWPKETCDLLRSLNWPTVLGNHDRQVGVDDPKYMGASDRFAYEKLNDYDRKWLCQRSIIYPIGESILTCHGTPFSNTDYLIEEIEDGKLVQSKPDVIAKRLGTFGVAKWPANAPALILCGHSHIPSKIRISEKQLVVNVGSVGLPAYDDTLADGTFYVSETGSPNARYAIINEAGHNLEVELQSVAYDHEKAAVQAENNGRHDWAIALRTGRMR